MDMQLARKPRFQPMVGVRGRIIWCCPYCGTIQSILSWPGMYRFTCKAEDCGITLEWGFTIRPPCPGQAKPPDTIMDLAPIRKALWRPRRLSARDWIHDDLGDVDISPAVRDAVRDGDNPAADGQGQQDR